MVLLQKWPFFQLFFLVNLGQENVSYDILERKNTFLRYKNKQCKKPKNWHFFEGVNPWFCRKMAIFAFFFLSNLERENVFYHIVDRKNSFLRYKNKKLKKKN